MHASAPCLAKNLELIMTMVARGISVEAACPVSRRRRSPCKQRDSPVVVVLVLPVGRRGIDALETQLPAWKREACISCVEVWSDPGTAPSPSGHAFFSADLFFFSMRRERGRDICLGAIAHQSPNSVRWSPGGDIAGSPTTGLPNSALSWLQCRRPCCCWLGAARHIPPAEEWDRLSGWKPAPLLDSVGDQVGQLAGCLMSGPRRRPRGAYQRFSRASIFVRPCRRTDKPESGKQRLQHAEPSLMHAICTLPASCRHP